MSPRRTGGDSRDIRDRYFFSANSERNAMRTARLVAAWEKAYGYPPTQGEVHSAGAPGRKSTAWYHLNNAVMRGTVVRVYPDEGQLPIRYRANPDVLPLHLTECRPRFNAFWEEVTDDKDLDDLASDFHIRP